jgi:hypothetical protein
LDAFYIDIVFWLNVDKVTGAWKLHKEYCRHSNPVETNQKGKNQMKTKGGWFKQDTYQSAYTFFQREHEDSEYWQPCRSCNPK